MRAVSVDLSGLDVDLDAVAGGDGHLFVRDGAGIAGRGDRARVSFDEALDVLAAIPHDDRSGGIAPGPVAVGVKPFPMASAGQLVVPEVVVGRRLDGRAWLTAIGPDAQAPRIPTLDELRLPASVPSAGSYRLEPVTPIARYLDAVVAARGAVRAGELIKAVIARTIRVIADEPIDVAAVLARLRASFGSSFRYCTDGLIGASPELLVSVDGRHVRSYPLAGTAPRTGDPDTDAVLAAELVASTKNQVEHRVVIDVVHDTLLPWCSYLDWEPEPGLVTVANVQHLGTAIEGQLSSPRPSVLELVTALSPTPALGGHPRDAALALIERVEAPTRGRYGGAVGWVDATGNGTWAVAIRGAELTADRREALLFAGGGIVAESDPLAELAETQAKFQAMLSALVRP